MAMAKPIIGTRVSGIPEVLGESGWIVEPGNPERLSESIRYVFDHKREAAEKGLVARERCIKNYSYQAMEKEILSVVHKVLLGSGRDKAVQSRDSIDVRASNN